MNFSHIKESRAKMVDISDKNEVPRRAVATGEIHLKKETIEAIHKNAIVKGPVVETARIAAIMAVKKTSSVIPMCHQIPVTGIDVRFETGEDFIKAEVEVKSIGKTGVEMEALHGVSIALLTIWDMVKSAEKDENGQYPAARINNILVSEKVKG